MSAPATSRIGFRVSRSRLGVLSVLAMIITALAFPAATSIRWLQPAIAVLAGLIAATAVLGYRDHQHLSTRLRLGIALSRRNHHRTHTTASAQPAAAPQRVTHPEQVSTTMQLRTQPHRLSTGTDPADQLPWQLIAGWCDRYGIRTRITVTTITTTPPASTLRTENRALLAGRTQHRDTYLTVTIDARENLPALHARTTDSPEQTPIHTALSVLADTTSRRLAAHLQAHGWLLTACDPASTAHLPTFTPAAAPTHTETRTHTSHPDGHRTTYTIDPTRLPEALTALARQPSIDTWTAITLTATPNGIAATATAATHTRTPPTVNDLPGLTPNHGRHHHIGTTLSATSHTPPTPATPVAPTTLAAAPWPTTATGIPIGYNRHRQPIYCDLHAPQHVHITITGTPDFHTAITEKKSPSPANPSTPTPPPPGTPWPPAAPPANTTTTRPPHPHPPPSPSATPPPPTTPTSPPPPSPSPLTHPTPPQPPQPSPSPKTPTTPPSTPSPRPTVPPHWPPTSEQRK